MSRSTNNQAVDAYINDVLAEEPDETTETEDDPNDYLNRQHPYHKQSWFEGKDCKKNAFQVYRSLQHEDKNPYAAVVAQDKAGRFSDNDSKASGSHQSRKYLAVTTLEPLYLAYQDGLDKHLRIVVDASGGCLPFGYVTARIESRGMLSEIRRNEIIEHLRVQSAQAFTDAVNGIYTFPEENDYQPKPRPNYQPRWHKNSWTRFDACRITPQHVASSYSWRLSPATSPHKVNKGGICFTEVIIRHVLTHSAFESTSAHLRLFVNDKGLTEPRQDAVRAQRGKRQDHQVTINWTFDASYYEPTCDHLCLAQTAGSNKSNPQLYRWSPFMPLNFIKYPGAHDFVVPGNTELKDRRYMVLEVKDHPMYLIRGNDDFSITRRSQGLETLKNSPITGPAPLVSLDDHIILLDSLPERADYPLPVIHALLVAAKNLRVPSDVIRRLHGNVAMSLPEGPLRDSDQFVRAYHGIRPMPAGNSSIEEAFVEKLFLACFPHTKDYTRSRDYLAMRMSRVRRYVSEATRVTMTPEQMRDDLNVIATKDIHVRHLTPLADTLIKEGIQMLYIKSPLGSGKSTLIRVDLLPVLMAAALQRINAGREQPLEEVVVLAVSCRKAFCYTLWEVMDGALGKGTVEVYDKDMDKELQKLHSHEPESEGPRKRLHKHKVYQFESLHKLLDFMMAHPGLVAIVVLDESESILSQAKSPTNGDNLELNLAALTHAINDAQFVICMDGLMTDRSLACIQGMSGYKPAMYIENSHKGNNEPVVDPVTGEVLVGPQRIAEIFGSRGQRGKPGMGERMKRFMVKLAPRMAAQHQKLFFGSAYQKTIQEINEELAESGLLPEGKEVIRIDSTKRHPTARMANMTQWFGRDEVSLVMSSPSMTVGNNADVTFTRRFVMCSANSADPFAMAQMSGRIRHFSNRTTYLALDDRFERNAARSGDVFPVFERSELHRIATENGIHDPNQRNVWVYNTQILNVCRYYTRAVLCALYEQLGYELHMARDPYAPWDASGDDSTETLVTGPASTQPVEIPTEVKKKRGRPKKNPVFAVEDDPQEPTDDAWMHTEPEIRDLVMEVMSDIKTEAAEAKRNTADDDEDAIEGEEEDTKKKSKAPAWDSVPVITGKADWGEWNQKMKEGDVQAKQVILKWRYLKMFGGREFYAPHPDAEAELLSELVQHWDAMYPSIETIWHNVFYCNMRMTCGDKADIIAYYKCNDVSRNFMDRLKTKYDVVSMMTEGLLPDEDKGGLFVPGKVIAHDRVKKIGGHLLRNLRYMQNLFELNPRSWADRYSNSTGKDMRNQEETHHAPMQHNAAIISDIISSWTCGIFHLTKMQQRRQWIEENGNRIKTDVSDYAIEGNTKVLGGLMTNAFFGAIAPEFGTCSPCS